MQKVLVAEIGSSSTIVKAFAEMNMENPRLLGQGGSAAILGAGNIRINLEQALVDLENNIGPVGRIGVIPFYAISSISGLNNSEMREIEQEARCRIIPTVEAIKQAALLICEEAGDILVVNVEDSLTDLYLVFQDNNTNQTAFLVPDYSAMRNAEGGLGICDNASDLAKLIGENKILE